MVRLWGLSVLATAVSTYALDAIATAAGITLVAAGVLGGLTHPWLLALLVSSYGLWGAGLRAGLLANGRLLVATGASTNVLSKAAYDLTRRRTANPRTARVAAAAGYTGTEILKELPYYAGAFGTAVVSDSVTTNKALVFLIGANLGAAVYEYALARLTGVFLRRRSAARAGVLVVDPLEQVARLAVENPAHGLQGGEADRLGAAVLEDRDVCRCEPDRLGELADTHLALGQLDVDADDDRHQITACMSVRSVVACRSRARMTTISSPSTVTPTTIRNSSSGTPGSDALNPT
jgi:hypothetical protein